MISLILVIIPVSMQVKPKNLAQSKQWMNGTLVMHAPAVEIRDSTTCACLHTSTMTIINKILAQILHSA